jgi:hypothetical protein
MDLGGIHGDMPGSFNVANYSWLQPGKEYSFDLFYAERHVTASTIRITSNIFAPPANIRLYPTAGAIDDPNNPPYGNQTTVKAGDPLVVYAHVFDDTGAWRPEYDQQVTFQLNDPEGLSQIGAVGNMAQLAPSEEANRQVTITATFVDPQSGVISVVTLNVTIAPGDPDHITIEGTQPDTKSRDDNQLTSVELSPPNLTRNIFAVVRDKYGNYIRGADQAVWTSANSGIATVEATQSNKSQGMVAGLANGQTTVSASEPTNPQIKAGTVAVTVSGIVEQRKAVLVSAVTRDIDGNGYLDQIVLSFDSLVTFPSQVQSIPIVVKYAGTTFVLDSTSQPGQPATLHTLYLREQKTPLMQTGWKPLITIGGLPGAADIDAFEAKDGAGPVIQAAYFRQGQQLEPGLSGESEGTFNDDTLLIVFSEPVAWDNPTGSVPSDIFNYFDSTGVINTQALATIQSSEMLATTDSARIIITNSFRIIPGKDSVNIRGGIADMVPNKPNSQNARCVIQGQRTNIWRPYAAPNPFDPTDPQSAQVPNRIIDIFQKATNEERGNRPVMRSGFIAEVTPLKESFAEATIYDGVGNVVVAQRKLIPDHSSNKLYLDWDGKNRNGRIVGSGTYTAVITVTSQEDGEKQSKKMKIGIKR